MIKVAAIVSLSSCYAGIFEGTGLLKPIQGKIEALSRKITPFGATFAVAAVASMIACNQTLSIMLTHQLCKEGNPDNKRFAIDLENTAVVLAPLVPWSIAGAVPLAAVGAPIASVVVASYLYILPIWSFLVRLIRRRRKRRKSHMNLLELCNLQGSLFLMILAGAVLKRRGIISKEGEKCLTDLA